MAGCCSNGVCSSSSGTTPNKAPTNTNTNTATTSRASSNRSVDSSSYLSVNNDHQQAQKVNGTSTVLAMLPAGKSCCAENPNDGGGGGGCGSGGINETSNVLVQYTLQDLDRRAEYNFWLGLICLGVCAVNIVLMYLNWALKNCDPKPNVSHRAYHLLEFWTSCVYSIAETFALVMSPKTMQHIYNKPNLLKLLLFFNVVNSMIPALLMTLDFEYFENISHQLEYLNEFTLSFITMILLASLLNPPSLDDQDIGVPPINPEDNQDDKASLGMGLIACCLALTNFFIFSAGNHTVAHYLEFSFNILVALVTAVFCFDSRFLAQMEIGQILYGKHNNCIFCQIRTNDFETNMQSSARVANMFERSQQDITIVNPIRGALAFDEAKTKRPSFLSTLIDHGIDNNDEEMQRLDNENTPLLQRNESSPKTGEVLAMDSEETFHATLKQYATVVVLLSATWCQSSQTIQPKYAAMAKRYATATMVFCTIDVDELDSLAEELIFRHGKLTPSVLVYQSGKQTYTHEGADGWEDAIVQGMQQ